MNHLANPSIPSDKSFSHKEIIIKFFKKYWFYIALSLVILLFFVNEMLSIILGLILVFILIIYYLIIANFKYSLIKLMNKFEIIDDQKLSEELLAPLADVRKAMRVISKKAKRKPWIVVCINNRCIFYNIDFINIFIELYDKGLNEKSIFNSLVKDFPIRSRAEIKAIEERLLSQERIEMRDFSKIKLLSYESKL
jgi:hypothetical protein